MTQPPALTVEAVTFHYREHRALDAVSFAVHPGEIFGLLGPNGGGKTTLFRLIATLLPLQQGEIQLFGYSASTQAASVRHQLGVTFQSPSVDIRLTVAENLLHHGQLYGLQGAGLRSAVDRVLTGLGLQDRRQALVETLSGGLKRRVEIAKSLLPGPQFLLLDEPSTGLDPGARLDLWEVLTRLQREQGVTVLVTTHLMDEAERCDRLAILDRGQIVACDSPARLRQTLGGDCLTIRAIDPQQLAQQIHERCGVTPKIVGDVLRLEHPAALELFRDIAEPFRDQIASIALSKPTLEDVFIERTGHRFWDDASGNDVSSSR